MVKIAVVGVKSDAGREVLELLCEKGIKATEVTALEAKSPLGTLVSYGEDDELDVWSLEEFDFEGIAVALFATSKEIGRKYIKKAVSAGVKVIDLSGASFSDAAAPMIIAGFNEELLQQGVDTVLLPSSATYQILLPLAESLKKHRLVRLRATVFASTSYYGREAMDELFNQSRKVFMNETLADDEAVFKKQIAFNVLPQVGEFIGEETEAEWRINAEIKKIVGGDVKVHANAAFVPTFIGDGVFVNAEFADEIDASEVRAEMKQVKNVVVFDKTVDGGYVSVDDVQGEDAVYVSRVRQDISVENGISFWSVADNLRAGCGVAAEQVLAFYLKQAAKVKH